MRDSESSEAIMHRILSHQEVEKVRDNPIAVWSNIDQIWLIYTDDGKLLQHEDHETLIALYHLTKSDGKT